MERVLAIVFDDDAQDAGALVRMRVRLDGHDRTADAGVNGRADKARLLADELADLHIVAGVHNRICGRADVHGERQDDGIGLRELLERQMLGIILVLGGMHAAVEALKASGSGFGDVGLDLVDASHGVVTQLNRLMEEFLCPALLFKPLIDLLPSAVFFGIDLALAVFRAAALPVDKTLRAVHDGTDAARRVQIALGACAAGFLRQRHAMMADIIQRIGCGKRGNRSKIGHRLHAQSAGNDNNIFRSLGDKTCKRLFGLDLVAQEVYLDRTGDVLALRLSDGGKAAAIRLLRGFELFEALVAGDDEEIVLPRQHAFKLLLAL